MIEPINLEVNNAEVELLRQLGTVDILGDNKVKFTMSKYMTFEEFIKMMADRIAAQESDFGCWITAKEWKEARDTLLPKLRKQILRLAQAHGQ